VLRPVVFQPVVHQLIANWRQLSLPWQAARPKSTLLWAEDLNKSVQETARLHPDCNTNNPGPNSRIPTGVSPSPQQNETSRSLCCWTIFILRKAALGPMASLGLKRGFEKYVSATVRCESV
jgi:hypothetical protein